MKIGIYICGCGSLLADVISTEAVREALGPLPDGSYVAAVDFICTEAGEAAFVAALEQDRPERMVIAACSPRDHEVTFRHCLSAAGINPYLLQIVNLREQIAWVSADAAEALDKTVRAVRGAVARVQLQEALTVIEREVCPDVLVIGAGPAGIKAALALADAGRRVVLVERGASLGGLPVHFEKVFPAMECAACMLEPAMMELLNGGQSGTIELLTLAEVAEVKGFYGNFHATIRQRARHVSATRCIGCGECAAVCPVLRSDNRRAIDFSSDAALPHIPYLDETACLRYRGAACQLCSGACPVAADVIEFHPSEQLLEREVGAVIVATGAALYDAARVAGLKFGTLPDVYDALQFQQMLSTSDPGGGVIATVDGRKPASVAIIHCVGSLDDTHVSYCSGICCQYALTFNSQIAEQLPDTRITHFYRELVLPGKQSHALLQKVRDDAMSTFIRYVGSDDLSLGLSDDGALGITVRGTTTAVDMVVLCNAVVPAAGSALLAEVLDAPVDGYGFFLELHDRMDACCSRMRGIFPIGACREPMDIQRAVNEGLAAAALVQAGLQPGRKLEIEPVYAEVDQSRCSACRLCATSCPYRAVTYDQTTGRAVINPLLCRGCGACAVSCPASVIKCLHFTDDQIIAEIKGQLA